MTPISWKGRAIEATKGNQSFLGTILIAILGFAPSHPPRIVTPWCRIDADGWVWAGFESHSGDARWRRLCSSTDMQDNFRGLADHLKLSDADRLELFALIGKWIDRDERAIIKSTAELKGEG